MCLPKVNSCTGMQLGKHSPKLVEIRKAIHQSTLTPGGLLAIEGPVLLGEAQRSGIELVDVFIREGTPYPAAAPHHVHKTPADVFKTIQETEHSQGIIATVRPREFSLADVLKESPALIVVL